MELTTALKIITGQLIVDSDLSKVAKYQLLNFVENQATDYQLKVLLMDGEIINHIDEQGGNIIDARFEMFLESVPAIQESISHYVGMKLGK